MVQPGPRFGGGNIMEQHTTNPLSPSKNLEEETLETTSMDPCLDHLEKVQPMSPRTHYEVGTERLDSVKRQFVQDIEYKTGENFLNEIANSCLLLQHPGNFPQYDRPVITVPKDKVNKTFEVNDEIDRKESCLPYKPASPNQQEAEEQSNESRLYKDDVEQLISQLKNLGINVKVKKYIRSPPVSDDSSCQKTTNRGDFRPIDLSYVAAVVTKPRANTCEGVKRQYVESDLIYCKNLFLKDRKGQFYLVIAEESALVDFKHLKQQLNAARNLSFADTVTTKTMLGLKSGEINPFVAMRKSASDVRFVIHHSLTDIRNSKVLLAFHPLDSSLQVDITMDELITFLDYHGKHPEFLSADIATDTGSERKGGNDKKDKNRQTNKITISKKGSSSGLIEGNIFCDNEEQQRHVHGNREYYGDEDSTKNIKENLINQEIFSDPSIRDEYAHGLSQHTDICQNESKNSQATILSKAESNNFKPSNSSISRTVAGPLRVIYGRKGKLKSFLKRCVKPRDSIDSKPTNHDSSMEEISGNETEITTEGHDEKLPKIHDDNNFVREKSCYSDKREECLDIPNEDTSKVLPEITRFYKSLSDLGVRYQEVDLRVCTTRDIGPSLGCKCFLLKDRGRNNYFVITHEYYELDYGRLKKALKPRKKIDEVEAADILDSLGVQPFRVTPFSCTTDRARSKKIMVFMTEKILPPEVILCIQHPYANGCRLVMSSGELQRYILMYISQIGTVEEKAWPAKFNRAFSQFSGENKLGSTCTSSSHVQPSDRDLRESYLKDSVMSAPECNSMGEVNGEKCVQSETEDIDNHIDSIKSLTLHMFRAVIRNYLPTAGFALSWTATDKSEMVDGSHSHSPNTIIAPDGSSVDPLPKVASCQTADQVGKDADPVAIDNPCPTMNAQAHTRSLKEKMKQRKQLESISCSTVYTVDNIICHLEEIGVEFSSKIVKKSVDGGCEIKYYPEMPPNSEDLIGDLSNEIETDFQQSQDPNIRMKSVCNDEGYNMRENPSCVEICSTTYLIDDQDNHYLIVGGESDYVTVRRFCRRFHLPGKLKVCDVNMTNLATTPFAIALSLRSAQCLKSSTSNIYLVLFTSIYIDPETKCIFHPDKEGSSIEMTSLQLERFASESGMGVWYMP